MLKLLSLFLVAISLNLGLINAQTTTTAPNCGYGFYKNGAVCTICPAGYSCNGLTKTACPLGTSTNNATGAGQCTECLQDTYAPTVGSKFCLDCPAGSFCPNKTTAIACGKGTAGRINQYDYRWNASQCLACPVGTYASVTGSAYCKPCTNGSYCADPTLAPVACPKGTSSMVDTSNMNTLLYYSPDAQGWLSYNSWNTPVTIQYNGYQYVIGSMCFPCTVGFYADVTGLTYCKVCPSGYYCADKTIAPVKCPKGYYSQNGTNNNYMWPQIGDTCTKCPVGTYTPTTGSVQCSGCPDGKYCPDPSLDPVAIPAGAYSQNNTYWNGNSYVYVSTLYQCSPGYYVPNNTNGTNSTYNNYYMNGYNCVACPAGYYCQDPKKAPIPCPPGFYSQYGYASSCQPCQAGYYASQPGSTQCTQCPIGAFCADPTIEPTLCPPGSYSPSYGQTQCYACSPGYNYASQAGSTQCTQCPMDCCCKDPTQEPVCSGSGSSTPNWWQTTPPYWGQSTSGWNNYWQSSSPPPYSGWSSTPPPWQSTQYGQSSYPYGTSSPVMGRR